MLRTAPDGYAGPEEREDMVVAKTAFRNRKSFAPVMAAALLAWTSPALASPAPPCGDLPADLLDLHAAPKSREDRSFSLHFDSGAWHGFALPERTSAGTGFVGPYSLAPENGRWIGTQFAEVRLEDASDGTPITLQPQDGGGYSCPGWLERRAAAPGISVEQKLFTPGNARTLVRIEIRSSSVRTLRLSLAGRNEFAESMETSGGEVIARFGSGRGRLAIRLADLPSTASGAPGCAYAIRAETALRLQPGVPLILFVEADHLPGDLAVQPAPGDHEAQWQSTQRRWRGYLAAVGRLRPDLPADPGYPRIAAKAVQTLIANWRAPRGDLYHAGLFPSYSNRDFNGFWAWDSWKHAVALVRFAPDLARDQVRAMFDYQDEHGMVADAIYADKAENNWRDTKPPLAAWAVAEIFRATGDRAFVREMYPRLLRYHRWWYANRDHDRDGLAEYGSTDGTRIAAAWESGMDNAVRFDAAKMIGNGDHAWSLDQESVDLNAYLHAEKLFLADLAGVVGDTAERRRLRSEARALKALVRKTMFDPAAGYFHDTGIADGKPVRVFGPEGWIPLWAGIATPAQARQVAAVMLDPARFATKFPFPTLDASHPAFSPIKGYWRGPVWMDQAWFAVEALERNGFGKAAGEMRLRLLDNAVGLKQQAPFHENYDPLTGNGYQSRNFSWSAAHYLLLLTPSH